MAFLYTLSVHLIICSFSVFSLKYCCLTCYKRMLFLCSSFGQSLHFANNAFDKGFVIHHFSLYCSTYSNNMHKLSILNNSCVYFNFFLLLLVPHINSLPINYLIFLQFPATLSSKMTEASIQSSRAAWYFWTLQRLAILLLRSKLVKKGPFYSNAG